MRLISSSAELAQRISGPSNCSDFSEWRLKLSAASVISTERLRIPCFSAFRRETALPASVRGPVERLALARLACSFRCEMTGLMSTTLYADVVAVASRYRGDLLAKSDVRFPGREDGAPGSKALVHLISLPRFHEVTRLRSDGPDSKYASWSRVEGKPIWLRFVISRRGKQSAVTSQTRRNSANN